jgi:hypothetical protein
MITAVLIVSALILGYVVAVGLLMAATFGISSRAPGFVAKDYRIRNSYKVVHELTWLVCAAAGGYVAATVSGTTQPWISATSLVAVMILVLWTNTWEMRQRGILHQMLISLVSAAGVAAGFMLRLR